MQCCKISALTKPEFELRKMHRYSQVRTPTRESAPGLPLDLNLDPTLARSGAGYLQMPSVTPVNVRPYMLQIKKIGSGSFGTAVLAKIVAS